MNRRAFLGSLIAPAFVRAEASRPKITHGTQSGDPAADSALLWVRGDRPSRMLIEVASDEKFSKVMQRIRGPHLLPSSDFTGRHVLTNLPAGADLHYRITLEDLKEARALSEVSTGHLRRQIALQSTPIPSINSRSSNGFSRIDPTTARNSRKTTQ